MGSKGWRRVVVVVGLGVTLVSCGRTAAGPSGTPSGAGSAGVARGPSAGAVAVPAALEADNQPPAGRFVIHPNPPSGPVPLAVRINMCRSTDPQPDDQLKFTVEWGDGEKTRGSCRLDHVYERAGQFQAEACVSDRVRDNPPSCQRWTVGVGTDAPPAAAAFATLTITPSGAFSLAPGFWLTSNLTGGPVSQVDANSATRIVVTVSLTTNTYTTFRLGLGNMGALALFLGGAPNLGGQTGTFSYELTPGQFTAAVDRLALELGGPGTADILGGTVTFYR